MYRVYVTDALGAIVNTNERWSDWVTPQKKPKVTAVQAKENIRAKLRS